MLKVLPFAPCIDLYFRVSKSQILIYFASQVVLVIIIFVFSFQIKLALPLPPHSHTVSVKSLQWCWSCLTITIGLIVQGFMHVLSAKHKESTPAETGHFSDFYFSSITNRGRINFQKEEFPLGSLRNPKRKVKRTFQSFPTEHYDFNTFSPLGTSPQSLHFLRKKWTKGKGGCVFDQYSSLLTKPWISFMTETQTSTREVQY